MSRLPSSVVHVIRRPSPGWVTQARNELHRGCDWAALLTRALALVRGLQGAAQHAPLKALAHADTEYAAGRRERPHDQQGDDRSVEPALRRAERDESRQR